MSTAALRRRPLPASLDLRQVRNPAFAAVGGLTLLAAVLRLAQIGHQGFWFDEANTALLVHFSPGKMIGLIPQTESTPPLYYCVAWVWVRVFGYGEAGLRSLSALAGVATVPVAYGIGAQLFRKPRAGVIAAALTACNPLLIWYSQEARSYALLVLLSSAALLAFVIARGRPTRGNLVAWVLLAGLSLATHYYALLAVVPQAIWILWEHRRLRAVQIAVAAVAVCGLALIPLAISQNHTGHAGWIASVSIGRRLGQVVPQFLVGFGSTAYNPLIWIAIASCLAALGLLWARGSAAERSAAGTAGALALAGLILNLLLVAIGVDDLITRNVIALWMPAAVLIAGCLAVTRARPAGAGIAVVLCAIGLVAAVSVASDRNLQRPDWRAVAAVLGTHRTPTRAILVQHYRDLLPLSLYLPRIKGFPRHGSVSVRELDIVTNTDPPSAGFCWWGSACNLWPSRAQARYPVPGFHELWRRRVHQFTVIRLIAEEPVALTRTAVAGALTATRLKDDGLLIQRP